MGGKVFKDGSTRRYDAAEYFVLVPKVLNIVSQFSSKSTDIPAFFDKPDFGDMDVLFVPTKELSTEMLNDLFQSGGRVVHNGGVWSLVYDQIQVDLITTTENEFDVALNYFSFNDFGNLRGRIHHKLGLKFGHDGLWFPVRSKDHTLGEILLTTDPQEIDKFGDFSYDTANLTSLDAIFNVVAASKYFNPDIFLLENRNHTSRVRDRKRATYTTFLEWCKTLPPREYYQFDKDKSVYHRKIFKAFPHAKGEFDELWRRKLLIEQAATMFNGDLVKLWTGREGADLGELMKVLKLELTPEVVIGMMDSTIYEAVIYAHNNLLEKRNATI